MHDNIYTLSMQADKSRPECLLRNGDEMDVTLPVESEQFTQRANNGIIIRYQVCKKRDINRRHKGNQLQ